MILNNHTLRKVNLKLDNPKAVGVLDDLVISDKKSNKCIVKNKFYEGVKMAREKNSIGRKRNNKYTELDTEKLESINDNLSENDTNKIIGSYCGHVTKTTKSGPIVEVEIYPVFKKKDIPEELRVKCTPEARKNLNSKNAKNFFIRKLNTNFGLKDYWITLTYLNKLEPKSYEEALKNIRNYFIKLNRLYKKKQLKQGVNKKKLKTIKYIYIIEKSEKGKWHYHIVMNSVLTMEEVEGSWKHGRRNNIRFLYPDEEHLKGLGEYLTKDPKGRRRWGCSKNLKNPIVTRSKSKFSNKKINRMLDNYNFLEEEIKKAYTGYELRSATATRNEINGKIYIYVRMRKIN